ncbi:LysE family translocator [Skermanella rosea]|uniref:LysE family translocator n=1 Tax=Skermanella rosea TaxID=1817965 RepID=UPI0019339EFC|nr:LysE family translocator [Skermanella rosea]UEM03113.1 LysE family translocator [Skermanella rosea]
MTDPIAFVLAVIGLLATPGPTNTLLAASGAAVGFRRSLHLILAEAAGYLCSILVLAVMLGPATQTWPSFNATLRILCGAYLAYLAWRHWSAVMDGMEVRPVPFARVYVTTLLNPKALVLAFTVVPHLGSGAFAAAAPYLAGLVGLIVLLASCWITVGTRLTAGASGRSRQRWVQRVSAGVLGLFAVIISGSAFAG